MINRKGFTLIEVVVVILVIATLALLVVPSFKNSALTNKMEKAKVGLVELTTAVKLYNEVNPNSTLTGAFDREMFEKLINSDQGYAYLQSSGRWGEGNSNLYALRDTDGVMNCRYTINPDTTKLSQVICQFNKVDESGTECYKFYIEKANPAVIKKESNEADCNDF